jgi:Methyltransferase domain
VTDARALPVTTRPSLAKRTAFRVFLLLERLGLHVVPRHFYGPVADRRWLRRNPELWQRRVELAGVDWDLRAQLGWLRETCEPHLGEVEGFAFMDRLGELGVGFRYGYVEGQILHCVVRSLAPPRIVEVGSGASTVITSEAARRNSAEGRADARIVAVDPYAPPELRRLENVEVRDVPAQLVPAELFAELGEGDLLFLDSTHVVKTGSELYRLYLEVLPALAAGVTVHIHDIYLPFLFSPWVLGDFWDWQETALLAAVLTHNPRFEVLCCESALHDAMPEELRELLPDYRPMRLSDGIDRERGEGHYPSSIWLRTR